MSGFALISDSQKPIPIQAQRFAMFRESVAQYKQLTSDCWEVSDQFCAAAKFDMPSTLHRGITVDEQSGSWLLAVGTVLDSDDTLDKGSMQTLLTAYLNRGNAAFQNLDGPFALVVYDKSAGKLSIISDPLGFVSVFYARQGSLTYVATSALAVAQAVQATPSEYGLYSFLMTGCVFGRSTLWQEVERLPAGTILEVTQSGSTESVYWVPAVRDEITNLSLTDTIDYTLDLLSNSTIRQLKSEEVWADLTGGFDSRLVTMLMKHCDLPFKASCQGAMASRDVRISSLITRELRWDYQHNILPANWGQERYKWFPQALGKADGHLDVFKSSSVLWDQEQRASEYGTSIWGLGGELWRGTIWKQEYWRVGKTPAVNYDRLVNYRYIDPKAYVVLNDTSRSKWFCEELKALFKSVGDRYADRPNTVKLDCIFAYEATGHTGAHISAVMGQQRVIPPLYSRASVTGAISTHHRWRAHSRLVRLLMEQVNPALASFETTDGGPALPMRVTNLHQFIPYWSLIGKQFVRKTSQAILGRSLLSGGSSIEPASYPTRYPLTQWRRETLDCLERDGLLDHARMHSGRLYDAERLVSFLEQAHTEGVRQETLLSRIVTVEMALRAVGASF